jgi:pSer/pThr/pTyr-binding forkhead associated (FHA) protein
VVYPREAALGEAASEPEPEPEDRVTLTVEGRVVRVTSRRVVVGRSRDADVRVDDGNVSRRHFELVQEDPTTWVVVDLGSTNGTEVNGRRVSGRKPLTDGDRITIGSTELVFGRGVR